MAAETQTEAILRTLISIDTSLKQLVRLAATRGSAPAAGPSASVGGGAAAGTVASDRDLDGPRGNPEVRFDPRDWTGPSFKGRRMSECPADFLDLVAKAKDYFAKKADDEGARTSQGKPKSVFERLDASRARGWAARIRAGKHTPAAAAAPSGWAAEAPADGPSGWTPTDDDIPF